MQKGEYLKTKIAAGKVGPIVFSRGWQGIRERGRYKGASPETQTG